MFIKFVLFCVVLFLYEVYFKIKGYVFFLSLYKILSYNHNFICHFRFLLCIIESRVSKNNRGNLKVVNNDGPFSEQSSNWMSDVIINGVNVFKKFFEFKKGFVSFYFYFLLDADA